MQDHVIIVGAGILGLAHALSAAKRGKRVTVVDRDAQANGASIRNFGFVTVTGQEAGDCWNLAVKARGIWAEMAEKSKIPVLLRGLVVAARFAESEAVIDAFLKTEMGAECRKLTTLEAQSYAPALRAEAAPLALYSPHELRVESRQAIPLLASYLQDVLGVTFIRNTVVTAVDERGIETATGRIEGDVVIVCPGDDFTSLFPERIKAYGVTRCKLQMLRITPARPVTFQTAVMSDPGLGRYLGYALLPEAAALKARLDRDMAEARANGIHLIVTQSADGSLVVGDSHHYSTTPDPFGHLSVDQLILDEFNAVLDLEDATVSERWIGTYASAPDRWRFTDRPHDNVAITVVTAGCGASTAFGIAEETLTTFYGSAA